MNILPLMIAAMLILSACNPPAVPPRPFPPIDTSLVELHNFAKFREDSCWLSNASYYPYYIGPENDTVVPDRCRAHYNDSTKRGLNKRYEKYVTKREQLPLRPGQETPPVSIRIDTLHKMRNGFPVIVKNEGKDTIQIGYDEYIPLLLEAKDSAGVWHPIEKHISGFCGFGMRFWILPPGEIALTFAPVTRGSFKTELRLRFEDHYSEPFRGSINYRQFESIFTEKGKFKPEYLRERKAANANKKTGQ